MFDSDYESNDMSNDQLDSGHYKASRMTEEQVQEIDELWRVEKPVDIEPYKATHMTEEQVREIDELWRVEKPANVEPYKATHLTEEQMKQTDEIWKANGAAPYQAVRLDSVKDISPNSDNDSIFDLSSQSLEEQFAAEVDALSLDDLSAERERLAKLSEMDDLDIFAEFDKSQRNKYDPDLFNTLTDGLPRGALEQLKNGLATGDPNVYDYFGLNGEKDVESTGENIRSRRK